MSPRFRGPHVLEVPPPFTHCVIPLSLLDKLDALVEAALALDQAIKEQREVLGTERKREKEETGK